MDINGVKYLSVNLEIVCYSRGHILGLLISIMPFLLVFMLIYPSFLILKMRKIRDQNKEVRE